MKAKQFISKNLVAIVMIPLVVGAHYGWYKLQQVNALVTPEERNKLQIVKVMENFSLSND